MALRLIRVVVPESEGTALADLLRQEEAADRVALLRAEDGRLVADILVPVEESEALMDRVEERFGDHEGFRLVVLQTQAVLPREEEPEPPPDDEAEGAEEPARDRISREELYADVTDGLRISPTFLAMAGLAAVVAAVGLLRNDVAVIVGAMVIAPLLRPNVALALATTLADRKLAWQAALTNAAGSALALTLAVAIGMLVAVDPAIPALANRSAIDYQSLILALAAGAAGSLAFTRGLAGAVIGVMVAVALLPPLVAAGLLLGAGHFHAATGAFLLTAGNLVSINLAGVVTFLLQGIRPRSWWEAERAKRATLWAAILWLVLLLALAGLLALGGELGGLPIHPLQLP